MSKRAGQAKSGRILRHKDTNYVLVHQRKRAVVDESKYVPSSAIRHMRDIVFVFVRGVVSLANPQVRELEIEYCKIVSARISQEQSTLRIIVNGSLF
jgi:hypothetical protein